MLSLILVIVCFILWGFTNDISGVMANALSRIFLLDITQASLINIASFLGYLILPVPIAIFAQRTTYKRGIIVSLAIYATGIILLYPTKIWGTFSGLLLAYFIMTCGSAALETCCHPVIYKMGDEKYGIFRLNLAQAFNAFGACIGVQVTIATISKKLNLVPAEIRKDMPQTQFEIIKQSDLSIIIQPYFYVAAIILILITLIAVSKFFVLQKEHERNTLTAAFGRLFKVRNYWEGLLAEFCYIGAQVCLFTYFIVYGKQVFMAEGMDAMNAEALISRYSMYAFILFAAMRFVCTWLTTVMAPGRLLSVAAILTTASIAGSILFADRNGIYCLLVAYAGMSLMFPTIFGMALRGVGNDIKYASAGLVMMVFAGSIFPPIQAAVIEWGHRWLGPMAVNISFVIPLLCMLVVVYYGHSGYVRHHITKNYKS